MFNITGTTELRKSKGVERKQKDDTNSRDCRCKTRDGIQLEHPSLQELGNKLKRMISCNGYPEMR